MFSDTRPKNTQAYAQNFQINVCKSINGRSIRRKNTLVFIDDHPAETLECVFDPLLMIALYTYAYITPR